MTELLAPAQTTKHRGRWKWLLAFGGLLLILGISGVSMATLLQLTSLLVFGPLLLVSSLMQLLRALFEYKAQGKEAILHFVAAVQELVLGILIMTDPIQGVVSLVAWVAILLVAGGLIRLTRSLLARPRGRRWTVLTGVIALLLGVGAWIGWHLGAGLWLVGLCLAVDILCHGASWSAIALTERKLLPETTQHD